MSETQIALELPAMRVSYEQGALDVTDLAGSWFEQLELWLEQARRAGLAEPNAMVLATADPSGRPSSRTVLCKGIDERGVVFYTNYTSAKSHDLMATRFASATFPWFGMQRQAHVRGIVEKVSAAETAAYWA
ncbi:MAG TPA: pyridoxal 5'-phosphate synthase, partial [Pseudonocardiaceae bacterium]|nr:pyridoxal 5'-phosphate synthase [Pseudonocardiaceae bacterium]